MRISDWSSDVCSSDLAREVADDRLGPKSDAWYLIIRWESPRPLSPAILDHAPDFRLHRQCQRAADRPLQREAAAAEGDAVEPRVAGRKGRAAAVEAELVGARAGAQAAIAIVRRGHADDDRTRVGQGTSGAVRCNAGGRR